MAVGEEKEKNQNVILMATGSPVTDTIVDELLSSDRVFSVLKLDL
jgi:hypothetical protein